MLTLYVKFLRFPSKWLKLPSNPCKHTYTQKNSKRVQTPTINEKHPHRFLIYYCYSLMSLMAMHCLFKEKQAKTKREATISYYSQQPCPPKAMTTCFYCKQYYYLWLIKAQGLCIMSHIFSEVKDSWAAGGPAFYRTSEPTRSTESTST